MGPEKKQLLFYDSLLGPEKSNYYFATHYWALKRSKDYFATRYFSHKNVTGKPKITMKFLFATVKGTDIQVTGEKNGKALLITAPVCQRRVYTVHCCKSKKILPYSM
jgi:hypothetical protein